ncbi:hypothetical protein [Prodigiosinella confusarubida]|uniref:hypothetical protein n=1 Tax=Serratia sp. (strain ATCC 39006) TaxID=104623 RepID=UPI000401E96A|nr:hypothetical protein [Serratia sp. ATCC 39006]
MDLDITWLPSVVHGRWYYLYPVEDVFSRWCCMNGAAMKSQTLQVKLTELNISASHSRPRVSNDNADVESLFRILKYVPAWPSSGFKTREEA